MSESKKHEEFLLNETKCHLPEQVHSNSLDSNNHSDTENNIFWEQTLRKKNSFSNPLLSIPPSTSNANCEVGEYYFSH